MKNTTRILTASTFLLLTHFASAGSATWKLDPVSNSWTDPANWTPATVPDSPTDIATFGVSNERNPGLYEKALSAMQFTPGATSYFMYVSYVDFYGAGVVNNSGVNQQFYIEYGGPTFYNNASAGASTTYTVYTQSQVLFYDNSTAGSATFNIFFDSNAYFSDHSTAANATFTLGTVAGAVFDTGTSAGAAFFTLTGQETNYDSDGIGAVGFYGGDGGSATFIAESGEVEGGLVYFNESSTGGTCSIQLLGHEGGAGDDRDGRLDISEHDAPGISVGSLEGSGLVLLGSNNLTVGTTEASTTFSGLIEDANSAGSLTKTGNGHLTLANASTYGAGTTVEAGILLVNNRTGSGTGTGNVHVRGGTFGGRGIVAGAVTVGTGSGTGAFLAPGRSGAKPGTFTIQKKLTLKVDATYKVTLDSRITAADKVSCLGATIRRAVILFNDIGASVLPTGTIFTVIDNTAATPIAGTFSNLPNGGMVTVGSNTFQANYGGGDGNDLTLTVVP